ncbi:hypothetical protein ES703_69982 [subsurface metagenome]
MGCFNEHDEKGQSIIKSMEKGLAFMSAQWDYSYKSPIHDIARRFLNEIVEFEPLKEG